MREKDFIDVIDLKTEYKEYRRFRLGKSKRYRSFEEWDAHLQSLLGAIESPNDIYNLKRYCIDEVRSDNDKIPFFWNYFGLVLSVVLALFVDTDIFDVKAFVFLCFGCFLFFLSYISNLKDRKKYFYEDILNVINTLGHKDNQ